MNRAEECAFAWALADLATAFVDESTKNQICVRLGAGEYRDTITALLECFARSAMSVPPALSASLWAWVNGFVGSDFETSLRDLASKVRISAGSYSQPADEQGQVPPLGVGRRENGAWRLVTAK
ncbi:hypothetical protein MPRF_00640 [Mycolicibacterium parafortuitum]|uniref:Uncharacterized protein n=1 Tax=Mycolicibacterium parafortuitum TaxID=39692 RepID=A0A7I7TX81_MYCPF|nr:hypothetical protein [Mycolicibacterium parafortuitum]BBY73165.1 hypothetical protein MPRF_00640 [Mycolicibacterium parafortuitum]